MAARALVGDRQVHVTGGLVRVEGRRLLEQIDGRLDFGRLLAEQALAAVDQFHVLILPCTSLASLRVSLGAGASDRYRDRRGGPFAVAALQAFLRLHQPVRSWAAARFWNSFLISVSVAGCRSRGSEMPPSRGLPGG